MFKNLRELITSMPDEKACRDYLVQQRWNDKPICPFCFSDKVYVIENGKRFKCGNSDCYKKFSVTVGTIFEASNIPLTKWFMAIYLCTAHKKGISSYQLGRDLGIAQKNAWFMLHRIREMMRPKKETKLNNIVEVDEVYIGGKVSRMKKAKRVALRESGQVMEHKAMVMGMIERSGELKLVAVGKEKGANKMLPVVTKNVDESATIITDGHGVYSMLNNDFAGHEVVNHAQDEYVRDKTIHTNTIEGAFSHFKRSIYGIYHQVSVKHLSRYCDETAFRYNLRKMKDSERFSLSLTKIEGRLSYKSLLAAKGLGTDQITFEPKQSITFIERTTQVAKREVRPVVKIDLDGNVIAKYPSMSEASRQTGIALPLIQMVLRGKNKTTHGFYWKYE